MIASPDAIVADDQPVAAIIERSERVIGVRVLTEVGWLLGTVAAVLLQDGDDRVAIVGYELRRVDKAVIFMPTPRDYSTSGIDDRVGVAGKPSRRARRDGHGTAMPRGLGAIPLLLPKHGPLWIPLRSLPAR